MPSTKRCSECSYGTLIIGGGPAGMGVLACAAQRSCLPQLLSTGIAVVEASGNLGRGSLGNWAINSNSKAGAFCECVESGGADNPLRKLATHPAFTSLKAVSDSTASLVNISALNEEVGSVLALELLNHPACDVFTHTKVVTVKVTDSGCCEVTAERTRGEVTTQMVFKACRIILATGGHQAVPLSAKVVGQPLSHYADKLVTAESAMVTGGVQQVLKRVFTHTEETVVANSGDVIIVGGSHSAFSVAWLFLKYAADCGVKLAPGSLTMLYRTPLKLYFPSVAEAEEAGYKFTPEDVCAVTGRVYRLAGLRGDSLALARQVLAGTAPDALRMVHTPEHEPEQVHALLHASKCIIPAFGFVPRMMPLLNSSGEHIILSKDKYGMLVVTRNGHPIVAGGVALPQIFTYGLGAGLPVGKSTGGELSFRGRTDGVWLYQNDVGVIVLRQLVPDAAAVKRIGHDLEPENYAEEGKGTEDGPAGRNEVWHQIYTRKAGTSDTETPLHCLNGYEMIDTDTWFRLVRQLVAPLEITEGSSVFEAGCGAGAFLEVVRQTYNSTISGIDFCQGLVDVARIRAKGTFHWGDVTDIDSSPFGGEQFDYVLCFGVFLYLDSLEAVETAIRQMLARVKPGGRLFVGEVSDLAKRELAMKLRGETHVHEKGNTKVASADHMYVPREIFVKVAAEFGVAESDVDVRDHDTAGIEYPTAPYRYSVYIPVPAEAE